jgi:hypothetical protein
MSKGSWDTGTVKVIKRKKNKQWEVTEETTG